MEITRATRITLAGVVAGLMCLFAIWSRLYDLALVAYLITLASDVFDGREARKSGVSFLGHICDRIVRDPLVIIATLLLVYDAFNVSRQSLVVVITVEIIFFGINTLRVLLRVKEKRKFYYFWNYGKQAAYSLVGIASFYALMMPRDFLLVVFFCLLPVPLGMYSPYLAKVLREMKMEDLKLRKERRKYCLRNCR